MCFAKYSKLLPCRKKEEGRKKTGRTIRFVKRRVKNKGRGGYREREGKGFTVY
jgi:hypothetical protein